MEEDKNGNSNTVTKPSTESDQAHIDTKVVAHKDLEITIKSNGEKIGKLLISKGNIEWLPKGL